MPAIPQDYLFVLSIIISVVRHRLRTDNLSATKNSGIAGGASLVIVLITAWMVTGFTADVRADVLLCCSMAVSLAPAFKELFDLLGYQYQASSPLSKGH
jgi:hypothetical protein